MARKKTHEEFVTELKRITDTIVPIEEYKGSNTKIKFMCSIHKYCWSSRPDSILQQKSHCPICSGVIKTKEEFLNQFSKIKNSESIKILSKYNGTHKKIKVKCKIDGFEWETTPHSLLQGHWCRKCQNRLLSELHQISHEDFVKKANTLNPNVEVIGNYYNSETKITVKCKSHNIIYSTLPAFVLKGCGCKICLSEKISKNNLKSHDMFVNQLYTLYGDEVSVLDSYINDITPLRFKHKCGYIFKNKPTVILQNLSCPNCRKYKSKGEVKIEKILNDNSIDFESQQKYEGLLGLGGGLLSYDFYLPDYNLLIEYQGEYHDGTARNQTDEEYIVQQEHDKRKREYAKGHNIEMMEIWYWDFDNIEQILSKKININSNKKSA